MQHPPRSRRTLVLHERRPLRDGLRVIAALVGATVVTIGVVLLVGDDAHAVVPVSLFMLTIVGAAVLGGPVAALGAAVIVSIAMAVDFIEPEGDLGFDAPDALLAAGLFVATALALSLGLATLDRAMRRANAEKLELDLLADAARVTSTLDVETAIRRLALVLVPGLADNCAVDLLEDDGSFKRIVAADRRVSAAPLIDRLELIAPDPANLDHPASAAVALGEPVLVPKVDDAFIRSMSRDDDHLRITRSIGPRSFLAVPIADEEGIVGSIMLGHNSQSSRRFSQSDIPLVVEIAGRLARSIRHARAYESERQSVQVLQRTLLPGVLPEVEGVALSRLYRPAAAEVGGDWYAVVPISPTRVGLAVGDVAGHGLAAATVMANVRFALQALAFDGTAPQEVLTRLNALLLHYGTGTLVTVCYGILDLDEMTWCHASAGHVPPVLCTDRGALDLRTSPGFPLGVADDAPFADEQVAIAPGEAVVLYSDGLIERRGESLIDGIARLRRGLDRRDTLDLEAVADGLLDVRHTDDVVILAAEVLARVGRDGAGEVRDGESGVHPRPDEQDHGAMANGLAGPVTSVRLQPEPSSPARARRHVERALTGSPDSLVEAASLLATELVANVVQHAGTPMVLDVWADDLRVRIEVADESHAPPEPSADGDRTHGRGLLIVERLSDRWGVDETTDGKVVWAELARAPASAV